MAQLDLLQNPAEARPALPAPPENIEFSQQSNSTFRTISEVAEQLDVPQHVLRFWESRFSQIKPLKLRGGRRYYRAEDVEILTTIKRLLYQQGYTIKGAKKAFGKSLTILTPVAEPETLERKSNQLSVIRQELMGLRDWLKPYVE